LVRILKSRIDPKMCGGFARAACAKSDAGAQSLPGEGNLLKRKMKTPLDRAAFSIFQRDLELFR